jgi:hypothetical protein
MKETFETAEIEIITIASEDVIVTSNLGEWT